MKSAVMAVAVSGMGIDEVDTIQDIFIAQPLKIQMSYGTTAMCTL